MKSPRASLRTIGAFLLFGVTAAAAPPEPLKVAVDQHSVTISNVTPGGSVILFYCSRIPQPRSISVIADALVIHDDDRDGIVRFTPKEPIALRSVFLAVDEANSQYAAGTPPGLPLELRPLPGAALEKDSEGQVATLTVDTPRSLLLVVRPGMGAWVLRSYDGGPVDRDRHGNGRQQLAFEDAHRVDGKENAPKHLKVDDVVAVIDPGHLAVYVSKISN